ncbi:hypothetical protein M408DRAFT_28532 [Serendipita vermifera MAFF 305830]|uniref:Uncharacterized protein n=1 Tax=Serendipita vermifera MAFF 305830 TaxID=933852 RepID=A0A0C3ATV4_SERVB|nr:hypothetical protein M408DRAFT_28532 [Serendipita vermifera MAFF 305830]
MTLNNNANDSDLKKQVENDPNARVDDDAQMGDETGGSGVPTNNSATNRGQTPSAYGDWEPMTVYPLDHRIHLPLHRYSCADCTGFQIHLESPVHLKSRSLQESLLETTNRWARESLTHPEVIHRIQQLRASDNAGQETERLRDQLAGALVSLEEERELSHRLRRERNEFRTECGRLREGREEDEGPELEDELHATALNLEQAQRDLAQARSEAEQWRARSQYFQEKWESHRCGGAVTTETRTTMAGQEDAPMAQASNESQLQPSNERGNPRASHARKPSEAKRKREDDDSAPGQRSFKKAKMPSAAQIPTPRWDNLLRLPWGTARQRIAWAVDRRYDPRRNEMLEELQAAETAYRTQNGPPLTDYQRLALRLAREYDVRMNWERVPRDIPRAMRRNEANQVEQVDFESWRMLRDAFGPARARSLEDLEIILQAMDPAAFPDGGDHRLPWAHHTIQNGGITVDSARAHLRDRCRLTRAHVERYLGYVRREVKERRSRPRPQQRPQPAHTTPASWYEDPGNPRAMAPSFANYWVDEPTDPPATVPIAEPEHPDAVVDAASVPLPHSEVNTEAEASTSASNAVVANALAVPAEDEQMEDADEPENPDLASRSGRAAS